MEEIFKDGSISKINLPSICNDYDLNNRLYNRPSNGILKPNLNDPMAEPTIDISGLYSTILDMQNVIDKLIRQQQQTTSVINDTNNMVSNNINDMKGRMNSTISYIHNCTNCGSPLEIEENHPIFHCKFCGSTYIIGPNQIHSNY